MSSVELFCMSPTLSKWEKLDQDTKDLFIRVSNFCIKHKKGNVKLSNIILKLTSEEKSPEWEYVTLPKGSVLYRGHQTIPTEKNRATYYTPNIYIANLYMPTNKKGYLNVYKTKKDRINRPLKKHFTAYDFFTTDPEGTLVLAGIVTPLSTKTLSPIVTPSSITQLISMVQLAPI